MSKPSILQVEGIIKTLPIGYYAGRNIPVKLDEKSECSWYNPAEDCIGMSYDQLCKGVEGITTKLEMEKRIRANYYHELSHAILTPKKMPAKDYINIFEDERIERLLDDYYWGVDFFESMCAINGFPPPTPESPIEWFFLLCRYRFGKEELVKRVDEIIKQYAHTNRESCYDCYYDDVTDLYNKLVEDLKRNPEDYEKMKEMLGESGMDTTGDLRESKGSGSGMGDGYSGESGDTEDSADEGEGSTSIKPHKGEGESLDKSTVRSIAEHAFKPKIAIDPELDETLKRLFENYKRKNKGGSALQAHSGVINARLADRADYRMFERPSPCRGSNQFGSFHLNLFVDISGSFHGNEGETNKFIRALERIEQTNHMFSFDVITVGEPSDEKVLPKENRYIQANGGNHLSKQIFDIYRKQQFPQTANYNIIMFDGNAYSNDCHIPSAVRCVDGAGFAAFNSNNCTIVTDYSNSRYIDKYAPSARTVYTRNFNAEFIKNILLIMQQALS